MSTQNENNLHVKTTYRGLWEVWQIINMYKLSCQLDVKISDSDLGLIFRYTFLEIIAIFFNRLKSYISLNPIAIKLSLLTVLGLKFAKMQFLVSRNNSTMTAITNNLWNHLKTNFGKYRPALKIQHQEFKVRCLVNTFVRIKKIFVLRWLRN